ncbi:MAG: hypothetical protein WC796_01645 [Candidatus Pacearchaeota archaeon]|jgi:hypothetical protein
MALLDQVKQMKQMGYGDRDIAGSLQAKGVSPREINDAMAQLKIREAVTNPGIQSVNMSEDPSQASQNNMQQSITNQAGMPPQQGYDSNYGQNMQQTSPGQYPQNQYPNANQYQSTPVQQDPYQQTQSSYDLGAAMQPQGQETQQYPTYDQSYSYGPEYAGSQEMSPEMNAQTQGYAGTENPDYSSQGQGYSQEGYGGYDNTGMMPEGQQQNAGGGYDQGYGYSTETISEIADQLISEKLSKTSTDVRTLAEAKALVESKVEKIDQRLQRIESIIDQIQNSIMRKTMEQSQNIEDIKSELQQTQSSFSKVLNPLVNNVREVERISLRSPHKFHTKATHKTSSKKSKK